jgi:hypothetical protein
MPINNLRYMDDTAENIQKLQIILNAINEIGEEYDLYINMGMIKLMIVSYQPHSNTILYMYDQLTGRVNLHI